MIFIILSLQVKATIDAHEGDLDAAEAACAELEIGLGDDDIMPPPPPECPRARASGRSTTMMLY